MSYGKYAVPAALLVFALTSILAFGEKRPEIRITQVPLRGSGGPEQLATIAGSVAGVDYSRHKVLLYVRTNQWYVQPYADSPYTHIDGKGKWTSDTHMGAEYAALLVTDSHKNASPTLSTLPPVGGDVLAIDTKPGRTE
jgi:hypothetical protein